MEEGVAGGNFWEERVRQALSITITAASASLPLCSLCSLCLSSLSGLGALYYTVATCYYVCVLCVIFLFLCCLLKQKQVQYIQQKVQRPFGRATRRGRGPLKKRHFLKDVWMLVMDLTKYYPMNKIQFTRFKTIFSITQCRGLHGVPSN